MLLSKPIRGILEKQKPLQKSYAEAVKKHLGPTATTSVVNNYIDRETTDAQIGIRDLTLLAASLPSTAFSKIFNSPDFLKLIRAILGTATLEDERGRLSEEISNLAALAAEATTKRDWTLAVLHNSYTVLNSFPIIKQQVKSESEAQAEVEKSYRAKLDELEKLELPLRMKLAETRRITLDPERAEIAAKIIRLSIEYCKQQYSQIETVPAIVEPVSASLDKALALVDGIVEKIKKA